MRVPTSTRYLIPVSFMFPEMYQRDEENTRQLFYYVLQPFSDKGFPKRFVKKKNEINLANLFCLHQI